MKKNTLLMAGIVLALASCQKDELSYQTQPDPASSARSAATSITASLPATFTRKVLAEELCGRAYGDVPVSNEILADLADAFPDQVYIASMHNNDNLEPNAADQITNTISGGSAVNYPASMINRMNYGGTRFLTFSDYESAVNQILNTPADCGIAINSSIYNNKITVDVYSGFNYASGQVHTMNVYLVEDMVKDMTGSLAQSNNFNTNKFSTYYNMGNPIIGYTHNNVVRRIATPVNGEVIDQSMIKPGGIAMQTFQMDLPYYVNKANCSIVAFITTVNGNGVADNVLNVQKAALESTKQWN